MDNVIQGAMRNELSDVEIRRITNNEVKIMLYDELEEYENIIDAIGGTNKLIILFPTNSDNYRGHYIAILYYPNERLISHFDSYGLSPKVELSYSTNGYVKEKLLNNLYSKAILNGYRVDYNTTRLQKMTDKISDCGSWCSVRCRFYYLSNQEFAKMFIGQRMPPDFYVTCLTFLLLNDEDTYENEIKKLLKVRHSERAKLL